MNILFLRLLEGLVLAYVAWILSGKSSLKTFFLREVNGPLICYWRRRDEEASREGMEPCLISIESNIAFPCITVHLMKLREVLRH